MGFTGLSYWINAPSNAVETLKHHIINNHSGVVRGRWFVQVRSYRSVLDPQEIQSHQPPRSMATLTMNDAVFAMIEDPTVPVMESAAARSPEADILMADGTNPSVAGSSSGKFLAPPTDQSPFPHRRTSFVTITPPESLDSILQLLKAKWVPVRQMGAGKAGSGGGAQVTIEGTVFSIGQDWIIRAGHIILSGGALRGMLLEAEYLPLAKPPSRVLVVDDTADLLQNILTSLLPSGDSAKTIIFPMTDAIWDDVLFDTDNREEPVPLAEEVTDDIYVKAENAVPRTKRGDWTGIYRDQRSAFLLIGALKTEGIL